MLLDDTNMVKHRMQKLIITISMCTGNAYFPTNLA